MYNIRLSGIILLIIFLSRLLLAAHCSTDTEEEACKLNIVCPICLDPDDDSLFFETNCQNNTAHHVFHFKCFKEYRGPTCPICRFDLRNENNNISVYHINNMELIVEAANGNLVRVARLISYGLDINCMGSSTNFMKAASLNQTSIRYLSAVSYITPLIVASAFGKWEVVKYLLENGANVHNKYGGFVCLLWAIFSKKIEIIKKIIACNIDYNEAGDNVYIFLKACIDFDNIEMLKLLLDAGADINSINALNGDTPYIHAFRNKKTNSQKYLFERGADLSIKNSEGKTVFDIAEEMRN